MLKRFLRLILFWNPLICLAFTLMFNGLGDGVGRRWISSLLIGTTVVCFSHASIYLVVGLERLIVGARGVHSRLWYYAISALSMPFGLALGFQTLRFYRVHTGHGWEPPDLRDYTTGIFWGATILTVYGLVEARRAAALRLKSLEADHLKAQLSALTAQVNPHLLFNSLNTIASLIATDAAAAEETTLKLSELYRGILDSSRKTTHALSDELALCEAYLAVERARFGGRLRARIEAHGIDAEKIDVPALCLQPLVENAVRYAIAPRAEGGELKITVERTGTHHLIAIEDDGAGIGKSPARPGAGTGLSNCRARIALQYGGRGRFEITERPAGGTRVEIGIPCES